MSQDDTTFDFNPDFDPDYTFDPMLETAHPVAPGAVGDEARAARIRRRLDADWRRAQAEAERLVDKAGSRFTRVARRLPNGRNRSLAALAPMAMYAESALGNCRPQTLLGLACTLEADHADREVVSDTGEVAVSSTMYRVVDFLATGKEAGIEAPHQVFTSFLEDEGIRSLWPAIRAAVGGRPVGSAPNGDSEHSSLNFEVPSIEASDRDFAEVMYELDGLIGLDPVKNMFREFAALEWTANLRRGVGLKVAGQSRHMLFSGNPGTGKTTVARLVAEVLKASGSMPEARLVEADRSLLIGEWLGTSAMKTRKVADAALGGVLFIDEAYSLAGGGNSGPSDKFAQEALDTLVKIMEDDRDDLVVILAGYPEPMARLLEMNPGLSSRIGITIDFPDFTPGDLIEIFEGMTANAEYDLADEALGPIEQAIRAAVRSERFGNARFVRSLLEASIRAHALRMVDQVPLPGSEMSEELQTLRLADTLSAVRRLR
jgi:hypothetical protein